MDCHHKNRVDLLDDLITSKKDYKSIRKLIQGEVATRDAGDGGIHSQDKEYEELSHNSPELIFIIDKSGQCVFFNDRLELLLGYSREEALGKPFSKFFPIHEIPKILVNLKKIFRKKEIIEFKTRICHKNGSLIEVEINGKLILHHGDLAMQGEMRDISRDKPVQDALNESLKSYKGLFDSVSEAIYIQREDGVFIDVNVGATIMYGYSREEFIGRSPEMLAAPGRNNLDHVTALMQKTMQTGKPGHFEFWGMRKNGEIFPKDVIYHKGQYFGEDVVIATARDITEHKLTVERLNLYKKIIDKSTDAIVILNRDYYFQEHNLAHEVLIGYSEKELDGKTLAMVLGEDTFRQVKKELDEKCNFHGEVHANTKNGEVFLDITAISLKRECGEVQCYVVMERDITERKIAEHALRESESKYRILAEKMHDVVWILDLDLKLVYVSPSTEFTLGFTPAERMTMRIDECMVPESLDYAMQVLINEAVSSQEDMAESNRGILLELEYYHKDGTTRWLEQSINGLYDELGELTGIMGVAREITERKKAKDELQQSEESYRGLFNSVNDAIYVLDDTGKFIDVNDGAVAMYGYPYHVLLGKDPSFVSAPGKNDLENISERLKLAYEGEPQQFEFWGKRSNGDFFLKDVRVRNGMYFGRKVIVAMAQDITTRKQTELALRNKIEELEFMNNKIIGEENQLTCLKKEVNDLLKKLGMNEKYTI